MTHTLRSSRSTIRSDRCGLTLMGTLVASAVGALILVVAGSLYLNGNRQLATADATGAALHSVSLTLTALRSDLDARVLRNGRAEISIQPGSVAFLALPQAIEPSVGQGYSAVPATTVTYSLQDTGDRPALLVRNGKPMHSVHLHRLRFESLQGGAYLRVLATGTDPLGKTAVTMVDTIPLGDPAARGSRQALGWRPLPYPVLPHLS